MSCIVSLPLARLRLLLSWVFLCAAWIRLPCAPSMECLADEFARAQQGFSWSFPKDHGRHEQYETEWWYYTGQLYEQSGSVFKDQPLYGFQLTFFRKGITKNGALTNEYMAHAAITDIARGETIFSSRLGGGALGLSGASATSLRAWSGDWSVDTVGNDLWLRLSVPDAATKVTRSLRIVAKDAPKPWLQGLGGFSAKGACQGCASMYYSLPALNLNAQYVEGEREHELVGLGWMDHEFMTNSLSESQVGWDWMGLMLRDSRSLMLFRLRDKEGRCNFASGTLRSGEESKVLRQEDFTITPISTWRSEKSGAEYPVEWRIIVPSAGIDTVVKARVNKSELGDYSSQSKKSDPVRYWEGPVASSDESVTGYLEMTGYAGKVTL
jgi:predicted secreted hydrolase